MGKKIEAIAVYNKFRIAMLWLIVGGAHGLMQPVHRQNTKTQNRHYREELSVFTSQTPEEATLTSRRGFGAMISSAVLSSSIFGNPIAAHADPYNALIPTGSGGILQQKATILRSDAWTEQQPKLFTQLGISRIGIGGMDDDSSRSIAPLSASLSPFSDRDLYYPSSFVGDWTVTSTLQQKIFPFGPDFVPSRSLVEGSPRNREEKLGDSTTYSLRFSPAEEKSIADRASNLVSMSRAYQQLSPVIADSILWDAQKDPTRLTFQTEPITADMRPIGPRKAEVYLTARKTELSSKEPVFAGAERSRTVTVGTGSVSAVDQEVVTEFTMINDNTMSAVSRIAVYLTPNPNSREGVLWQQVNGKAVAFYDYEWKMERNNSI